CGLVAQPAAQSRRTVRAADLEGQRDAVGHADIGARLPPQDADAWFAAITTLLADPRRLRERGEAARAYVATHCSWRAMGLRYAERLDELV
ncbi:glycosyltransferase, partial [Lysobacter sp. 2RAB21]